MMNIEQKEGVAVAVQYRDGKYPYIEDLDLEIIREGRYTAREVGRPIYISGRLINNGKVFFKRISQIAVALDNAQIVRTEKGTLIIKYVPGATLIVIEVPSGFRGEVYLPRLEGPCHESCILRSGAGRIGCLLHVWCNGDAKMQYRITGRMYTAGYEFITKLFGEALEGEIVLQGGNVRIIFDEEMERILEG
jgi:hypothetical protein